MRKNAKKLKFQVWLQLFFLFFVLFLYFIKITKHNAVINNKGDMYVFEQAYVYECRDNLQMKLLQFVNVLFCFVLILFYFILLCVLFTDLYTYSPSLKKQ